MNMRVFISCAFLCASLMANAQQIVLKNVEELVGDVSARDLANRRTDSTGQICALVKVQFPYDGATFEGDIVGQVVNKQNEYWVFLPEEAKRLNIVHPDYGTTTIDFADYQIDSLASKRTYQIMAYGLKQSIPALDGSLEARRLYDKYIQSSKEKYLEKAAKLGFQLARTKLESIHTIEIE